MTSFIASNLIRPLLAQDSDFSVSYSASGHVPGWVWVLDAAIALLMIIAMWKVFTKAGWPGWASLIPFYNVYVLIKIAGRPGWWFFLLLIPVVNLIIIIVLCVDIAKNFGKGVGFALGLVFLPFIFYPILAFGSAQYQGGAATMTA
jgi:hypothetical protein